MAHLELSPLHGVTLTSSGALGTPSWAGGTTKVPAHGSAAAPRDVLNKGIYVTNE